MRIKPHSGFIELDIGFNVAKHFDKRKGIVWGEALRTTRDMGADSFGLASGFGKGTKLNEAMAAERGNPADDVRAIDRAMDNFDESVKQEKVLKKQTLGGQIIRPEPGKPMYMLGAFNGSKLFVLLIQHSTKLTLIHQMNCIFLSSPA